MLTPDVRLLESMTSGPRRGLPNWPRMQTLVALGYVIYRQIDAYPGAEYSLTPSGTRKANGYVSRRRSGGV